MFTPAIRATIASNHHQTHDPKRENRSLGISRAVPGQNRVRQGHKNPHASPYHTDTESASPINRFLFIFLFFGKLQTHLQTQAPPDEVPKLVPGTPQETNSRRQADSLLDSCWSPAQPHEKTYPDREQTEKKTVRSPMALSRKTSVKRQK